MNSEKINFATLSDVLPPIIWRHRWNDLAKKYGLPFRRGYLQNLDSLGKGPPKQCFGKRIAYRREDLIAWLNSIK
jgi:hypothetical protein